MQLLAEGLPLSLLLDLADPAGPHSADLLAHEGGVSFTGQPLGAGTAR